MCWSVSSDLGRIIFTHLDQNLPSVYSSLWITSIVLSLGICLTKHQMLTYFDFYLTFAGKNLEVVKWVSIAHFFLVTALNIFDLSPYPTLS